MSLTELPNKIIYPLHIEIEDNNAAYDFVDRLTSPTRHVIYQTPLPNGGTTCSTRLSTLRLGDPKAEPQLSLVRPDTGVKIFIYDLKKLLAKTRDYCPEYQFEYNVGIRLKSLPDNTHYVVGVLIDG